jgi:hypothetical protein
LPAFGPVTPQPDVTVRVHAIAAEKLACDGVTARATIGPRLILGDDLRDAEGTPRACIAIPGRRMPLAFMNIAAALAAPRFVESAR